MEEERFYIYFFNNITSCIYYTYNSVMNISADYMCCCDCYGEVIDFSDDKVSPKNTVPNKIAWVEVPESQLDNIKWLWKGKFKYNKNDKKYYVLIKQKDFDKELVNVE